MPRFKIFLNSIVSVAGSFVLCQAVNSWDGFGERLHYETYRKKTRLICEQAQSMVTEYLQISKTINEVMESHLKKALSPVRDSNPTDQNVADKSSVAHSKTEMDDHQKTSSSNCNELIHRLFPHEQQEDSLRELKAKMKGLRLASEGIIEEDLTLETTPEFLSNLKRIVEMLTVADKKDPQSDKQTQAFQESFRVISKSEAEIYSAERNCHNRNEEPQQQHPMLTILSAIHERNKKRECMQNTFSNAFSLLNLNAESALSDRISPKEALQEEVLKSMAKLGGIAMFLQFIKRSSGLAPSLPLSFSFSSLIHGFQFRSLWKCALPVIAFGLIAVGIQSEKALENNLAFQPYTKPFLAVLCTTSASDTDELLKQYTSYEYLETMKSRYHFPDRIDAPICQLLLNDGSQEDIRKDQKQETVPMDQIASMNHKLQYMNWHKDPSNLSMQSELQELHTFLQQAIPSFPLRWPGTNADDLYTKERLYIHHLIKPVTECLMLYGLLYKHLFAQWLFPGKLFMKHGLIMLLYILFHHINTPDDLQHIFSRMGNLEYLLFDAHHAFWMEVLFICMPGNTLFKLLPVTTFHCIGSITTLITEFSLQMHDIYQPPLEESSVANRQHPVISAYPLQSSALYQDIYLPFMIIRGQLNYALFQYQLQQIAKLHPTINLPSNDPFDSNGNTNDVMRLFFSLPTSLIDFVANQFFPLQVLESFFLAPQQTPLSSQSDCIPRALQQHHKHTFAAIMSLSELMKKQFACTTSTATINANAKDLKVLLPSCDDAFNMICLLEHHQKQRLINRELFPTTRDSKVYQSLQKRHNQLETLRETVMMPQQPGEAFAKRHMTIAERKLWDANRLILFENRNGLFGCNEAQWRSYLVNFPRHTPSSTSSTLFSSPPSTSNSNHNIDTSSTDDNNQKAVEMNIDQGTFDEVYNPSNLPNMEYYYTFHKPIDTLSHLYLTKIKCDVYQQLLRVLFPDGKLTSNDWDTLFCYLSYMTHCPVEMLYPAQLIKDYCGYLTWRNLYNQVTSTTFANSIGNVNLDSDSIMAACNQSFASLTFTPNALYYFLTFYHPQQLPSLSSPPLSSSSLSLSSSKRKEKATVQIVKVNILQNLSHEDWLDWMQDYYEHMKQSDTFAIHYLERQYLFPYYRIIQKQQQHADTEATTTPEAAVAVAYTNELKTLLQTQQTMQLTAYLMNEYGITPEYYRWLMRQQKMKESQENKKPKGFFGIKKGHIDANNSLLALDESWIQFYGSMKYLEYLNHVIQQNYRDNNEENEDDEVRLKNTFLQTRLLQDPAYQKYLLLQQHQQQQNQQSGKKK